MKRREFILLSIGLIIKSFSKGHKKLNDDLTLMLIGKKTPILFGTSHRLVQKASQAFETMQNQAYKAGIKLYSVSSYRSFAKQTQIWNAKFLHFKEKGLDNETIINKILEYSALPGTSRHHWGTDIDLSDLNVYQPSDVLNPVHYERGGVYEKLGVWLKENANKFGFYEVYTNDKSRKGFLYEPWHYSYAELSKVYLHHFLKIDFHNTIKDPTVMGYEIMDENFWESYKTNYILGINPVLI